MTLLRWLLIPFGWLYGCIVSVRNRLYDIGIFKSYKPPVPTICVGNLQVGGTGKTPHTEFLARWLGRHYHVAVLSRGYKRKTKGYLKAGAASTAADIGDEPLQMARKFPDIAVAVCEDRVTGIRNLMAEEPKPGIIILDDAMQHRAVMPKLSILLSEFNQPYYSDRMMPAGRLREFYTGEKRADILIFTKCPTPFSDIKKIEFIKKLDPYDHQEVYFTTYRYGLVLDMADHKPFEGLLSQCHVILVTGIANPAPFEQYLQSRCKGITCMTFPDHYAFSEDDMRGIETMYKKKGADTIIITTEKDTMRMAAYLDRPWVAALPVYYIPVEVVFLFDEESKFKSRILEILK